VEGKMVNRVLVFMIFLGIIFSTQFACIAAPLKYATYNDANNGFSIEYPQTWKENTTTKDALIGYIGPADCDFVLSNFVVTKGSTSSELSAKSCFDIAITRFREEPQYTSLSTDEVYLGDCKAIRHCFTAIHDNRKGYIQLYVITKGNTLWMIACLCGESCYKKYVPVFNKIGESFRLTR
jgi:hypothetical protein